MNSKQTKSCRDDEITKKKKKYVVITYSIRIEGKTIQMDAFGSKLIVNHTSSIDKKKKKVTTRRKVRH